jgi:hypothetical protein
MLLLNFALTEGALNSFNRTELSGVIAHEIGHIVNQDIKLNIQISAFVFGFTALFFLARFIFYNAIFSIFVDFPPFSNTSKACTRPSGYRVNCTALASARYSLCRLIAACNILPIHTVRAPIIAITAYSRTRY